MQIHVVINSHKNREKVPSFHKMCVSPCYYSRNRWLGSIQALIPPFTHVQGLCLHEETSKHEDVLKCGNHTLGTFKNTHRDRVYIKSYTNIQWNSSDPSRGCQPLKKYNKTANDVEYQQLIFTPFVSWTHCLYTNFPLLCLTTNFFKSKYLTLTTVEF